MGLNVLDIKIVDFFYDERSENCIAISPEDIKYIERYSQLAKRE